MKFCLELALLVMAGASAVYYVLASHLIRQWIGKKARSASRDLPCVTFLRPVKPGVPRLREKLEALVMTSRPGDQIILGVSTQEDYALCESVRAAHGDRDILVLLCEREQTPNIKIAKLIEMSERATHPLWILSDSEAMMDAGFLDSFRAEWLESGADVLTSGYRFAACETLAQSLDVSAILMALWPGLAVRRKLGPLDFTLGACTGFKREDLEAVGGWPRFGGYLAEDNRIGAALAKAGRAIRLSDQILTLDCDPMGWRDYFAHQLRVAVTYRVSSPGGYFGMLVTHGVSFATLLALLAPGEWWRWIFFGAIYAMRLGTTVTNAKVLGFGLRRIVLLVLAGSFAETIFWALSWLPIRVRWGGRRFRVGSGGLIRI